MRVGIAGASGYVGGELLRWCASHPRLSVAVATAERHVGDSVGQHVPSLAAAYRDTRFAPTVPEAFGDCDAVFLALPHGCSAPLVAALQDQVGLVVDLGADLRLADAESWERWYGGAHPTPELLGTAVYGLVERHRAELADARLVSVPGCYPTATVLALGPLVDAGIARGGPCVVDAMSGASGAGATPSDALHFASLTDDATAYGLEGHRHTAEMEAELGVPVAFTPHLVAMDRGLLATCHAPAADGATTLDAMDVLRATYDAEPFVVVTDEPPHPKAVRGTNVAHVTARVDERTGQLLALCAIDNLGKGAAGQAIQCANLAAGFAETEGARLGGGVAVSVVAPKGFAATGGHVGIKPGALPDCAVVTATTAQPAVAAGVFTTNLAAAAPVQVSKAHLRASRGRARAVVLTSGNANAATGEEGMQRARGLCTAVGGALGAPTEQVLVAQTGLIGVPFAFESCAPKVTSMCGEVASTQEAAAAAARAILTTDSVPKTFAREFDGFTVGAMAKGAAMLAPNLATMLCVLTTDASCEPDVLATLLRDAVEPTFNRVLVDGDPSTNDTVLALSSGLAGPVPPGRVADALAEACGSLARQMVDDAEGATRTVIVSVSGAASDDDAHRGARAVAGSLLVKCSLNGADPYWGRVVAALGAAGIDFSLDRVRVAYGGTVVCDRGVAVAHDQLAVAQHLSGPLVELRCELGLGSGSSAVLCCDLGPGYLDENRTTS